MATRSAVTPKTKSKSTSSSSAPTKSVKPKITKPTPVATKPAPTSAQAADPAMSASQMSSVVDTELKRKELVELVAEKAGLQKSKVKPAVEAMIAVLGDAIAEGRTVNLQPMGRMVRKRRKDVPNATVSIVRIRQSKPQQDDS